MIREIEERNAVNTENKRRNIDKSESIGGKWRQMTAKRMGRGRGRRGLKKQTNSIAWT